MFNICPYSTIERMRDSIGERKGKADEYDAWELFSFLGQKDE